MSKPKSTPAELKAYLRESANMQRDLADEMAAYRGGCDDPMHPWGPQVFRDYIDFVDRVCRPLVEADGDEKATQAAMALYRKENPYGICISMVMMQNRNDRHEAALARVRIELGFAAVEGADHVAVSAIRAALEPTP